MSWPRAVCCFCGETIAPDRVDPLVLSVMSAPAFESDPDDAPCQNLYCHYDCLRQRVLPMVPMDRAVLGLAEDSGGDAG